MLKRILVFIFLLTAFSPVSFSSDKYDIEKINTGINLLYSGRLDESLKIFGSLSGSPLDSMASHLFRGLAYSSVNDKYRSTKYNNLVFFHISEALKIGDNLLKADNKDSRVYLCLGGAYGVRGLRKAMLGDTWGGIKEGRKAHKLLHKALEEDSTIYDAYYGLGMYHFWKSKRAHTVIKYFGWLFRIKDERERGIRELYTAMNKGSYAYFPAMRALFIIFIEENRIDEFISLSGEYAESFPDDLYHKWFLGIAYIRKEKWKQSLAVYEEIEKHLQGVEFRGIEADVECGYYKALCLYHLGRKNEAEHLCREILEVKDKVNKNVFYFEDYIKETERLLSKINPR